MFSFSVTAMTARPKPAAGHWSEAESLVELEDLGVQTPHFSDGRVGVLLLADDIAPRGRHGLREHRPLVVQRLPEQCPLVLELGQSDDGESVARLRPFEQSRRADHTAFPAFPSPAGGLAGMAGTMAGDWTATRAAFDLVGLTR